MEQSKQNLHKNIDSGNANLLAVKLREAHHCHFCLRCCRGCTPARGSLRHCPGGHISPTKKSSKYQVNDIM